MNCPYIESNNPHCSENLNMQNMDEAFELCTDQYQFCPLYIQLSKLQPETILNNT